MRIARGVIEDSELPHPPANEHIDPVPEAATVDLEQPRVVVIGSVERQLLRLLAVLPPKAVCHPQTYGPFVKARPAASYASAFPIRRSWLPADKACCHRLRTCDLQIDHVRTGLYRLGTCQ